MIHSLLRALGVRDARPDPVLARFPETASEQRYECARQDAERTIARADQETEQGKQRLISWEDLYDPRRRS